MQINNISNQQNFRSIYRIQNYPVKTGQETLNYILKDIEQAESSAKIFFGNNPLENKYINKIEKDLKEKSYSYSYFKRQTNNNKIQTPNKEIQDVWIFTKKDKQLIGKFYKKFNKKSNYTNNIVSKELKANPKDSYKISHFFSKKILHFLDRNNLATETFQELVNEKNIIDLSELFNINHDVIMPLKKIKDSVIKLIKKIF